MPRQPRICRASTKDNFQLIYRPGSNLERVVLGGETLFYQSVADHLAETLLEGSRRLVLKIISLLGIGSAIYALLRIYGQPQGMLVVAGSHLTEINAPVITRYANQANVALENARLYQELKSSERQFRLFMDHILAAVFIKDERVKYVYYNQFIKQVVNIDIDEMIGRTTSEVFSY